ncbi:MAG: highly acidic protein [Campylobacterales bacterium]|nr:highly acidic protein [Campylobacterales bacterium]
MLYCKDNDIEDEGFYEDDEYDYTDEPLGDDDYSQSDYDDEDDFYEYDDERDYCD